MLVERFAAGGQAVTSSRIENYLGFPSGISGDELTERALKQAQHFGVETLFVRKVERVESLNDDHYVILDWRRPHRRTRSSTHHTRFLASASVSRSR